MGSQTGSCRLVIARCAAGLAGLVLLFAGSAASWAEGPTYQRKSHAAWGHHSHGHSHHSAFAYGPAYGSQPIQSGSFRRPYPYHLDYYKMRYGGSYAPYFGNIYGPPRYVSPYYGHHGYYSGGYGSPGYGPGYGAPGHGSGGYAPGHGYNGQPPQGDYRGPAEPAGVDESQPADNQ